MKGKSVIINALNQLLAGELTAADQYFIHAHMYENWGFNKLFDRIKHEQHDELEHAQALIKRILFLEGAPDMVTRTPIAVGRDVPEMLKNDLAVEISVVHEVREVMALCEQEKDYVTRDILLKMLDDTEVDHAHWLEKQLGLIERMGLPNYLQSATGGQAS